MLPSGGDAMCDTTPRAGGHQSAIGDSKPLDELGFGFGSSPQRQGKYIVSQRSCRTIDTPETQTVPHSSVSRSHTENGTRSLFFKLKFLRSGTARTR